MEKNFASHYLLIECPACGAHSEVNDDFSLIGSKVDSYVPTRYSSTLSQQIPFSYQLTQCVKCGNIFYQHTPHISKVGFSNTSIQQNEPDIHIDSAADRIILSLNSLSPDHNISLFLSSWKDQKLSDQIRIKSDSKTTNLSKHVNILLATRYIEHLYSIADLYSHQSKLQVGDYIYIEILDFHKLSRLGNQSFFWPERIWYPTQPQILSLYKTFGFDLVCIEYINEVSEPFWWILFKKQNNLNFSDIQLDIDSSADSNILVQNYLDLVDRVQAIARNFKSLSFYGMNHKAFALIELIMTASDLAEYSFYLFDSSALKINTIWNNIEIQDLNNSQKIIHHDGLHVFAFNPQNNPALLADIIRVQPQAKILHINDFFTTGHS